MHVGGKTIIHRIHDRQKQTLLTTDRRRSGYRLQRCIKHTATATIVIGPLRYLVNFKKHTQNRLIRGDRMRLFRQRQQIKDNGYQYWRGEQF